MIPANEIILASAGSGKTYRLSNRIVKLLAEGVPPAEILALTFTRKAAGEFARRTLTKLADAAGNPEHARRLAGEIELHPGKANPAFFAELLEKTVRALHRLRLGTLDSFFQSLVQTHFFELGLSGAFTLLDERLAETERLRVTGRIFRRSPGENDERTGDFLEAFKLATFGKDEFGVSRLMGDFVGKLFEIYRDNPDPETWGNTERLWQTTGCPWLPTPADETVAGAIATLREFAAGSTFRDKRILPGLLTFIQAAETWCPGLPLDKFGSLFKSKIMPAARNFAEAPAGLTIPYAKTSVEFTPAATRAIQTLLRRILGETLLRDVRMTLGIHALLRQYDAVYDTTVRRAGKLTFADMPTLLARSDFSTAEIGLRLDATVKHWLFDEFQDTNRRDWSILADNLDAVLTETDGRSSAFFVGDVKQALYGWRGGTHALLPEIRDRYELPEFELHETYRSCPEVVALVNAVFNNLAAAGTLPATALRDWQKIWHAHESAGDAREKSGYTAWIVCGDNKDAPNETRRLETVAGILENSRFLEKNLSCGLLTQNNKEARDAADFLRAKNIRVVAETDTAIAGDSPFIIALSAAVEFSAHPKNGYAAGTIAMAPAIAAWKNAQGGDEAMRRRILETIAAGGFEKIFRLIATETAGDVRPDAFLQKRLEQLFSVAREFDESGNRGIDEFLRFAREAKRREISAGNCVRVMTIHKAKGLEFDVVFLPFLDGDRIDSPRDADVIVAENRAGEPWIISRPEKEICKQTPALDENYRLRESEACYENLCKLYVALTRAKAATYVITTETAESKSAGVNFPRLLEAALGNKAKPATDLPQCTVAWECGARDWAKAAAHPTAEKQPEILPPEKIPPFAPGKQRARRRPSEHANAHFRAEDMLDPAAGKGAEFGTCVHALAASVPFVDSNNKETIFGKIKNETRVLLKNGYAGKIVAGAEKLLRECLDSPAMSAIFSSPADDAELWRERAFDVVLNGERVSGVFDRVIVAGDRVRIFDFKTDTASPAELKTRYAAQMNLYRRAAAKLCGVPPENVEVSLVHMPTKTISAIA